MGRPGEICRPSLRTARRRVSILVPSRLSPHRPPCVMLFRLQEKTAMNFTYADFAKMIDHSLLSPTLTTADLEAGCKLALAYDVASVCIMPFALKRCADILRGSTVKAST